MSKIIDFSKLGGLFFYQDTLDFMQRGYKDPLEALAKFVGEKFVVSGCVEGGGNCTSGFIVVNGVMMPFVGGAITSQIIVSEPVMQEGFDDGTLKDVFYEKLAMFGNTGGFDYTELKRLPFSTNGINDCVTSLGNIIKSIVQFEDEVIIDGCEVSNVTTGPDTLDISEGLVLFAGKLITTPAYSGAYPAYLKEDGGWVNVVPGAGLYITFDPYTSQRYKNVLDRALIPVGRIIMEETLSDRFVAGIGKWEMKGYELMGTMQNRVPMGLWYDGVPEANVSDATHSAAGNQGGEMKHTLTAAEIPAHDHHNGAYSRLLKNTAGGNDTVNNPDTTGGEPALNSSAAIASVGGDEPHENRQPFTIVVYAKRV